jgi:surface antigen
MRLLFAVLIAAASAPAIAQNWVGLLKNTPAERFDEDDLRIFMDAGRKALNDTPDNQSVTWDNPQTKAGGEITVLRSFESKGLPCKEVRVQSHTQGRKGDNTLNLCKKDGKWRLLSASQTKSK